MKKLYTCTVDGPNCGTVNIEAESYKEAAQDAVKRLNTKRLEAFWKVNVELDRQEQGITYFPELTIHTVYILMYSII